MFGGGLLEVYHWHWCIIRYGLVCFVCVLLHFLWLLKNVSPFEVTQKSSVEFIEKKKENMTLGTSLKRQMALARFFSLLLWKMQCCGLKCVDP